MTTPPGAISAQNFYDTYFGVQVDHLHILLSSARLHGNASPQRVCFLAGDSSLDNKAWINSWAPCSCDAFARVLSPPRSKEDVTHFLNALFNRERANIVAINAAVEASSLNSRACEHLLEQDIFIRDSITPDDVLVVSVGGNDIALSPLLCTVLNALALMVCTPESCVRNQSVVLAAPRLSTADCGCLGCGLPGCLTASLCAWPPGLGYFVDLFRNRVQTYIEKLVAKRKPRVIVVCMIYFPDENAEAQSWASPSLAALGYNAQPSKLQTVTRKVFELATRHIRIDGVDLVIPFPLFDVLDGSDTHDYVARVEPSRSGGEKMARALGAVIVNALQGQRVSTTAMQRA